jgi:hypothetical protein
MKKAYFLLLLVIACLANVKAQQPINFSVQADADDWQLYMSSRIMTDLNNNNKVVFITLTAGDEGNGVATFNGSGIPYYVAREKGGVYSAKFACDISVNGAVCTIDSIPGVQTVSINSHSLAKYVYKNTVSYFLRLPDGGADGNGFAATGYKSLKKLKNNTITSIASVDGVNTYNGWTDIVATISAIINTEKGTLLTTWLHTGSTDALFNPNDYSDHIYAATAAKDATVSSLWVGYIDYVNDNSSAFAANLSIAKFQDAAGIFGIADYALTENKYNSKLNTNTIKLLTSDSFKIVRTPVTCASTTGLTAGSVTTGSAVLNWRKITGAVSYQVDIKTNTSSNWTVYNNSVSDTSILVSGLAPSTTYQWRVKTNCSGTGNSSAYSEAQFSTSSCSDIMEYNNSFYYARSITPGQFYNAQISYYGDVDYYQFNNTSSAKNIKITLTNLPGDYDVKLYNQYGLLVGVSQNWGTNEETIVFNTNSLFDIGTYRVYIYGYGYTFNSSSCYSLKAEISNNAFVQPLYALAMRASSEKVETSDGVSINNTTATAETKTAENDKTGTKIEGFVIYPMPASENAMLAFESASQARAQVVITNMLGVQVQKQIVQISQGHNRVNLNVVKLVKGMYTVSIKLNDSISTQRLIINR